MGPDRSERRRRTLAALAVCAALAAAGCGGGGKLGTAVRDAGTTTQPPGATTPAPDPGDPVALALSALLVRDDFPEQWQEVGAAGEDGSGVLHPHCLAREAGTLVTSPAFYADDERVGQAVQLFADGPSARTAVAEIGSLAGRRCLAELTATRAGEQAGEPEQEKFAPPRLLADEAVGIRTCVPTAEADERQLTCSELSVYRIGSAVTLLDFDSFPEPFPEQLRDELTQIAVDRLDRAIPPSMR